MYLMQRGRPTIKQLSQSYVNHTHCVYLQRLAFVVWNACCDSAIRLLVTVPERIDIYEVDEKGFVQCQFEHGVPYRGTDETNESSAIAYNVSRQHWRHPGSYYFIGE